MAGIDISATIQVLIKTILVQVIHFGEILLLNGHYCVCLAKSTCLRVVKAAIEALNCVL